MRRPHVVLLARVHVRHEALDCKREYDEIVDLSSFRSYGNQHSSPERKEKRAQLTDGTLVELVAAEENGADDGAGDEANEEERALEPRHLSEIQK